MYSTMPHNIFHNDQNALQHILHCPSKYPFDYFPLYTTTCTWFPFLSIRFFCLLILKSTFLYFPLSTNHPSNMFH